MNRLIACGALACAAMFATLGTGTVLADGTDKATDAPKADPKKAPAAELTALIDAEIAKAWAEHGVTPAAPATDEEFLRRVYFDVLGVPPSDNEATEFLKDAAKDKRAKLIDKLIDDSRFGRHLADLWTPLLLGRMGKARSPADDLFAVWMAAQFNENRAFSQVVYDIITASGSLSENPAVAYYAVRKDQKTADFAGLASKQFTGVQIQCAQCHKHPYEDYTTDDFAGVASFFQPMQVRRNNDSEPQNPTVVDTPVKRGARSNPKQPDLPIYRSPKYLGGDEVAINDARLWRSAYAKWVIGSENAQSARYLANRFWSFYFGEAFVMPVDDFNSENEARLPALLDALGRDLRESNFDIKRFTRGLLNSKAYQLASHGAARKDGKPVELWLHAQYPVRQLTPEQLFGAIVSVAADGQLERQFRREAGNPFTVLRLRNEAGGRRKGKKDDDSKRKERTFDAEANGKFEAMIESMSDNWYLRRVLSAGFASQTSDDEMTDADGFTLTIDQALMVMNGLATSQMSAFYKGSTLQQLIAANVDAKARIGAIFMRVLSRKPNEAELTRFAAFVSDEVKAKRAQEEIYADVLMALLMTTEFATNH